MFAVAALLPMMALAQNNVQAAKPSNPQDTATVQQVTERVRGFLANVPKNDPKVFQDFFTELDLPVTLTQGDQVSIPVAVYNYSGSRGQVHLQLAPDDWFSLSGDESGKTLAVDSGRVGAAQYTIEARRIGKFKLTLRAEMEGPSKRADIVVREIEVVPNGREQSMVFNGRLDSAVSHRMAFPGVAIPDASTVFVRLYPGPLMVNMLLQVAQIQECMSGPRCPTRILQPIDM